MKINRICIGLVFVALFILLCTIPYGIYLLNAAGQILEKYRTFLAIHMVTNGVLSIPTLIAAISLVKKKRDKRRKILLFSIALGICIIFVDILCLLSDTRNHSGLGGPASILTTVHLIYIALVVVAAKYDSLLLISIEED